MSADRIKGVIDHHFPPSLLDYLIHWRRYRREFRMSAIRGNMPPGSLVIEPYNHTDGVWWMVSVVYDDGPLRPSSCAPSLRKAFDWHMEYGMGRAAGESKP